MNLFLHEDSIADFLTNQSIKNMQEPSYADNTPAEFEGGNILVAKYSGDFVLEDYWWRRNLQYFVDYVRSVAKNYSGFVLKIDTNGGHAAAAMEMDGLIQDIKKYGNVIVHTNFLHSAGIMGTTNADRIVANGEFASLGSVGVYFQLNKFITDLYKKYIVFVYSKKSPDKNKAFREFMKDGKIDLYKEMATKSDEAFMKLVRDNRPISDEYKDTLDGGVFTGTDAKLRGLCDHVGTLDFAIKLTTTI